MLAKSITGILIKKEYLAALYLLVPHKSAVDIVKPLLENPGNIASP